MRSGCTTNGGVTTKAPVETKVVANAAKAGAGAVISQFVVWLLGCWAWGASWSADKAVAAVSAVPAPVADLVLLTVTVVGAWFAAYRAPHTHRPDLSPVNPAPEKPPTKPVIMDAGLDMLTEPLSEV